MINEHLLHLEIIIAELYFGIINSISEWCSETLNTLYV